MESHYLISENTIDRNCTELINAFSDVPFKPSYSVKTNYIPQIVDRFHENGFLAEVVSDMEVSIARSVGIPYSDMVYNGPMKGERARAVIEGGGIVVFDSRDDLERFDGVGRCMFRVAANIENGLDTRFGSKPDDIPALVDKAIRSGFDVVGIHCHVTKGRSLDAWRQKIDVIAKVYASVRDKLSERIVDMGGNMYSNIPESMKCSFPESVSYDQYGELFASSWSKFPGATLMLEMGTSVVSDCMSYMAEVLSVKSTNENTYILLNTTNYSLGWCAKQINHPISVVHALDNAQEVHQVSNAKFVGRLCTEDDVMHRGYTGQISIGDVIRFENVGSYTVVVKPPFIMPQDPIYYVRSDGETLLAKRAETADDVLSTFVIGEQWKR